MRTQPSDQFHALLRVAIRERGLSLDSLQRRLTAEGHRIGRSTLSFWQSGTRRPASTSSLAAVAALERILLIRPGSLTEPLRQHREPPSAPALTMIPDPGALNLMVEAVGCSGVLESLHTTAFIDTVDFRADGSLAQLHSIHTLRALADLDRYPALIAGERGGNSRLLRHEAVSGCRVGRVARSPDSKDIATELLLSHPVRRGETYLLSFLTLDDNHIEQTEFCEWLTDPQSMVVLDIGFHEDRMPVYLEEYEADTLGGPDTMTRPRTLGFNRRVTVVRERAPRGIVGLRWIYPDDTAQ